MTYRGTLCGGVMANRGQAGRQAVPNNQAPRFSRVVDLEASKGGRWRHLTVIDCPPII